jgi:hypothetical protein
MMGLHNKPHGCSASVASAAGPFTKKKTHSLEELVAYVASPFPFFTKKDNVRVYET